MQTMAFAKSSYKVKQDQEQSERERGLKKTQKTREGYFTVEKGTRPVTREATREKSLRQQGASPKSPNNCWGLVWLSLFMYVIWYMKYIYENGGNKGIRIPR